LLRTVADPALGIWDQIENKYKKFGRKNFFFFLKKKIRDKIYFYFFKNKGKNINNLNNYCEKIYVKLNY
jgi:hypothetical protein